MGYTRYRVTIYKKIHIGMYIQLLRGHLEQDISNAASKSKARFTRSRAKILVVSGRASPRRFHGKACTRRVTAYTSSPPRGFSNLTHLSFGSSVSVLPSGLNDSSFR